MPDEKPIRVLYMEDDPGLARLLQKRLEHEGYAVDVAANGEEGLAMYEAGDYDVVAVDQNMPVYDGIEVIRLLTAQGPLPPTIMVTGTGSEEIAVEAMKLGAGDYIVKDVEGGYLELLPSVIDQVLHRRRIVQERRQALEELKQRTRDLALLNRLSQSLTATLDLQQVMERLVQAVTDIVEAEGGSVWLWDEEQPEWLVCRAVHHHGLSYPMVNLRLCPGEGIAGWVAQTGQGTYVHDVPSDLRFSPNIDARTGFHTTTLLAAPLRVRDKVTGVLEVVNSEKGQFDDHDLFLVETLAASAAIAIDNAQLVEELRWRTVELQARNEELDAFAHTVAHDLRSPLSGIIGYTDMLVTERDTMPREEAQECVEAVAKNGRKMANIVDELLVLSEVRKTEVQPQPLDMSTVVDEARQRLAYMAEASHAVLSVPDAWPAARGHAPWVEEVWVNYISNALKYGGQPPRAELGAEQQMDGMVRFWIRDNGPGLAPEDQASLFTPFTKLDQVRARGHGLGLSIVRRIVEKLGGEAGVESSEGEGSTFWFTLPT